MSSQLRGSVFRHDRCMTAATREQVEPAAWRRYLELTKPKVVMLITFTAIVGAMLASGGVPGLATLAWASAGAPPLASIAPTMALKVMSIATFGLVSSK